MTKYDQILYLRAAGYVKRWHTAPIIGSQTDAEHSAQALNLLFHLHPNPSTKLIKAVLYHDSAELVCGDMPAPIRKNNKKLAEAYEEAELNFFSQFDGVFNVLVTLTVNEKEWLKAIDTLELVLFCDDQILMGNKNLIPVKSRALDYLQNWIGTPAEVINFLSNYNPRSLS